MGLTDDIQEFHEKFALTYTGPPRPLNLDLAEFRHRFMEEEVEEYGLAVESDNLHEQLDALVDLVYVALGTAYMHGFNFEQAWARVHAANMLKVRGSTITSKRNSPYDVVKPEGWQPPDLTDLVDTMRCSCCGTDGEAVKRCSRCDNRMCDGCSVSEELGSGIFVSVCARCFEPDEAIDN